MLAAGLISVMFASSHALHLPVPTVTGRGKTTRIRTKILALSTSSSSLDDNSLEATNLLGRRGFFVVSGSFAAVSFVNGANAVSTGAPSKVALSEEYRQGTAALADADENGVVPKEAYKKLPSGVVYADLRKGSSQEEVKEGSRVNLQWVLRKSNGYFVDSSEVSGSVPFIFTVGDPKGAIVGVDQAVRGMKAGGVRRILIPPALAYVEGPEDGKPGPLPVGYGPRQQIRRVQNVRKDVPGEYIYLEVQVTRIR